MKRSLFLVFFLLATPAWAKPADRVVLISLDGLDSRLVEKMPMLNRLRRMSVWTLRAETPLPAVTVVSHAAMLTGAGPKKNGVAGQAYPRDPKKQAAWRPLKLPTVITALKSRGKFVSTFVQKPKMLGLLPLEDVTGMQGYTTDTDDLIPFACSELADPPRQAIDSLAFIHLKDIDAAGHAYGWMSKKQLDIAEGLDAAIEELRDCMIAGDALYGLRSILIITSDHGGHGRTHGTAKDRYVPWIVHERIGTATIIVPAKIRGKVRLMDTAPTILKLLGYDPRELLPTAEGRVIKEILKTH